jgi:hypothetical protein
MIMKIKVGLVVPSHSPKLFSTFIDEWNNFDSEEYDITLYLVDDNKTKKLSIPENIKNKHYCWKDIDKDLGDISWIIPRQSSACRSYGYYKAWQDDNEYILTLDHDCFPTEYNTSITALIDNHLMAMNIKKEYSSFFNVGGAYYPKHNLWTRGSPFRYRNPKSAAISVGGWDNNPDLDAVTQLENQNPRLTVQKYLSNVPKYMGVTICGMNILFKKDTIPISYFLLQGPAWGIDRWDDIWFGLFFKKIADKYDMPVCINGYAKIYHDRASDPFKSLYPEGIGYGANETLWDKLIEIQLEGDNILDSYISLSKELPITVLHSEDYTKKLKEAMYLWTTLFKKQ